MHQTQTEGRGLADGKCLLAGWRERKPCHAPSCSGVKCLDQEHVNMQSDHWLLHLLMPLALRSTACGEVADLFRVSVLYQSLVLEPQGLTRSVLIWKFQKCPMSKFYFSEKPQAHSHDFPKIADLQSSYRATRWRDMSL